MHFRTRVRKISCRLYLTFSCKGFLIVYAEVATKVRKLDAESSISCFLIFERLNLIFLVLIAVVMYAYRYAHRGNTATISGADKWVANNGPCGRTIYLRIDSWLVAFIQFSKRISQG